MTISKDEYDVAVDTLKRYREIYPDLGMIEDEVILRDIEIAQKIVSEYKYQKEKNESDTSKKTSKSSSNSEKTKDNRPWFLRGKASQKFYAMIIICREEELYYELNEIREEILRMKNSHAKNRYSKIYDYAMKQKI
jgi:hypothetical protein